jgi:hypothetical protein
MACEYAATRQETQVTILSDCQAAILATAKPLIISRTVEMTVDAINSLATLGKSIKIQWVRGHNRTTGNIKADSMAKEGAAMASLGPEPFLPYTKTLCKQETKAILKTWQKSIIYRQTLIFFPLPDASISKNLLRLSRKDLGLIIRHGTGHSNLNYHQSKQQPGLSPLCRLCGEKAK